jgi:hypothetical protein
VTGEPDGDPESSGLASSGAVSPGPVPPSALEAALMARGSRIALAGLVFSALFVIAWFLLRGSPAFNATDEELAVYYSDPSRRRESAIAGLYVVPFAGVAFIWFMAALRDRHLRAATRENTILSTAQLVAGALVVTSLFTLAAVELAVVWLAETGELFDVDAARSLLAVGESTSDIMALRSAAVFVGVSATRAVRSGLFPRSYGVLSMMTALALLLVYEALPWVALLFPAWVAGSSVLILVRRRAIDVADGA